MITASIVTYHTSEVELVKLAGCLVNSSVTKIYIIDNSDLPDLSRITGYSKKIEYFHGHGNIGYGAGHNIAIRLAIKSESIYHIVANSDIILEEGTIERLADYMNKNPSVGMVQPKVIFPNGELQYLCKLIPSPFDLISKRFFPYRNSRRSDRFQLKFTGYDKFMNVPYLSGCFMFFRVSALQKTGLFDERFFMYPEDIDITRRMHEHYETMFNPTISIVHAHAAASYENKKMLIIHIVNMIKYFNKWGWIFDSKRRKINREVLLNLGYCENK